MFLIGPSERPASAQAITLIEPKVKSVDHVRNEISRDDIAPWGDCIPPAWGPASAALFHQRTLRHLFASVPTNGSRQMVLFTSVANDWVTWLHGEYGIGQR